MLRKCKEQPSAGKVLGIIFYNRKRFLQREYHPSGSTATAETCFDTLMNVRKAVKEKRCGKLSRKIVLIHESACPHPLYPPDVAASDFDLFPGIKRDLGGQQFTTEFELCAAVAKVLSKKEESWYQTGTDKLVYRYNQTLNNYSDYV